MQLGLLVILKLLLLHFHNSTRTKPRNQVFVSIVCQNQLELYY